ncbi:sensory box histidine kinase/response regulator [Legionella beliardensis]|uniref:histidine kinase n=1 Tax=Legionella beliardensis TaxID=91822 RepID=A0A378I4T0_9GAMM|nr:MHYT domain-containing protein [Legionella beliardensis]STX29715.1 sensory box histidine kinase/response regulator [Legionella beliardensis]
MLANFFQLSPLPADQILGTYSLYLVILSYAVSFGASYVALDIANRVRDIGVSFNNKIWWILGGAFAMGAGIWSMHFIGMLAFIMPMPMTYDPFLTGLSMLIAITASGVAFSVLQTRKVKTIPIILGGLILGFSIASMHYVGMSAMLGMEIRYLPGLFFMSIIVAIFASEAALYFALKSSRATVKARQRLMIISALIMGAAICGMHYIGMEAAVFTPQGDHSHHHAASVDPNALAISIAIVTIFILGIALILSSLQAKFRANSVEMARKAGMAEVASNVLHNVGNTLNSVNVSASLIIEHLRNINLQNLHDLNNLISEHQQDLGQFITTDVRGLKIPVFLKKMADYWQSEFQLANSELNQLVQNIQHIKNIIAAQQKLSGLTNFEELVSIEDVIDEALIIVSVNFNRHNITVKKEYVKLKPVYIDKSKLTQILINLIDNAKQALLASNQKDKTITLRLELLSENKFCIEVIDNGIGIGLQNLDKIFTHGFTTKKTGHGFGLHASAIAAAEMKGSLKVSSEGEGKGAAFKISLPYKIGKDFALERAQKEYVKG